MVLTNCQKVSGTCGPGGFIPDIPLKCSVKTCEKIGIGSTVGVGPVGVAAGANVKTCQDVVVECSPMTDLFITGGGIT